MLSKQPMPTQSRGHGTQRNWPMKQKAAPDLILFGALILFVTLPECALAIIHPGLGTPSVEAVAAMAAYVVFGMILVLVGIYGQTWRARWRSRRRSETTT
jgi:hypothetical protein